MSKKTITVQGTEIRLYQEKEEDFVSLTDIAKKFNTRSDQLILNWMRRRNTIEYLGTWEIFYNEDFQTHHYEGFKNDAGSSTFVMSISEWVTQTKAIGIIAKRGRYGGTYAHKDIAFEFLSYLSPVFKLYVFREFQRLKNLEQSETSEQLDWNLKRTLSKVNYKVHNDAIKASIPARIKNKGFIYANEADTLNVAIFGQTAKMWRLTNEKLKGNIRDYASPEQLLLLANLEAVNAELIRMKLSEDERVDILNQAAIHQMKSLLSAPSVKKLDGKLANRIEHQDKDNMGKL